jgi:hypothetical protein
MKYVLYIFCGRIQFWVYFLHKTGVGTGTDNRDTALSLILYIFWVVITFEVWKFVNLSSWHVPVHEFLILWKKINQYCSVHWTSKFYSIFPRPHPNFSDRCRSRINQIDEIANQNKIYSALYACICICGLT